MEYKHKNIKIDFERSGYIDMTGETTLYIHSNFVAELIDNSCTFTEFFLGYQEEELFSEMDEDEDKISEFYRNKEEIVPVMNADAIIAVYEYCLENEEREFQFEARGEHITWVIHDFLHAEHDAAGCTIYVESQIERDRIIESMEVAIREGFELPEREFLDNLETEFYNRFKEVLDLEKYKYYEVIS